MNLLFEGMDRLGASLLGSSGIAITYSRGDSSADLRAVPGQMAAEAELRGITQTARYRVWLMPADKLIIDGSKIDPRRGDRIEEAGGATWEVVPLTQNDDCWRPVDHNGRWIKVTSRRIAEGSLL